MKVDDQQGVMGLIGEQSVPARDFLTKINYTLGIYKQFYFIYYLFYSKIL